METSQTFVSCSMLYTACACVLLKTTLADTMQAKKYHQSLILGKFEKAKSIREKTTIFVKGICQ